MRPARFIPALIATALIFSPIRAFAETNANDAAAAEALFDQAKKLMDAGQFVEACPKFAESNRLDSGIGTLLYLADCYEKSGKTASSWATFKEAAEEARKQGDGREKLARQRAANLEKDLSKLSIVVDAKNRVDGMVVTRDGTEVGAAQWSLELPIDPGEHRLTATAQGHKTWASTINVTRVQVLRVQIPQLDVERALAPPTAETPGNTGKGQRIVGLVIGGVGIVGAGVGTYFAFAAKSKADAAGPFCTGNVCQQPGLDDWSTAKSNGNIATGAFIIGGALIVAGAVIYFVAPSDPRAQSALADVARGGFSF